MSNCTNLSTGFYADNDNVYSRPKDAATMPYTWAKDVKQIWYDNGERIVYINPGERLNPSAILTAIDLHIKANNGRVYYEKRTRSCPVCSFPLLAYLLNRNLIGVRKDPFRYYSDKEGKRIYWQVSIHIRPKGQAMIDNQG